MKKFTQTITEAVHENMVVDNWNISPDKTLARFRAVGIHISAKYYALADHIEEDGTTYLNKSHHNKFKIEIEYDYMTPEAVGKIKSPETIGTYGVTLFADTMEEVIETSESFLSKRFPGINVYKQDGVVITPYEGSITVYELAKQTEFNSKAVMDKDIVEYYAGLDPLSIMEFDSLSAKHANARVAEKKYKLKMATVFEKVYGFPSKDIFGKHFMFYLTDFKRMVGYADNKEETLQEFLGERKLKLLRKVKEHYCVINKPLKNTYPELIKFAKSIDKTLSKKEIFIFVNKEVDNIESDMTYKAQYVLEYLGYTV